MDAEQREMLIKALSEAAGAQQEPSGEVKADLPEERYQAFQLDAGAIKSLTADNLPHHIAFVDGGNAELVRAPHLSLQLVRTCGITYSIVDGNLKREETSREEFFVLVKVVREPELRYEAHLLGKDKTLSFNPTDRALLIGVKRAEPSAIGGIVRRFSELKLATELASGLSEGDALVIDGTLEATYPGERDVLENAAKAASEQGVTLAALAKRCSLLTKEGKPLLHAVGSLAKGADTWRCEFAKGTTAEHNARLFALKLHPKARHLFRLDIHENTFNENNFNALLAGLALHSREATFPGYPYGLIEADKMARISNRQKSYHKSLLEARLGKRWQELEKAMRSLNAHDILDSM